MASKKFGLNKGLDVLLQDVVVESKPTSTSSPKASQPSTDNSLLELKVTSLCPGRFQPRRIIGDEELEALSQSIKSQGIIQPLVVRPISGGEYEIIAGERRWRAAQLAGLTKVPVVVKDVPDEAALAIAIIENIQRENLNPIEEAQAFERLVSEFGLSHEKIAQAVGKSRTTITNLLRLLSLQKDVRLMLERGDLEAGHGKVLLALQGPVQSKVAREVVSKKLSVRETERLVACALSENGAAPKAQKLDPDIRRLQASVSEKIGSPVSIVHSSKGAGKIVIKYSSLDELDGILEHIN